MLRWLLMSFILTATLASAAEQIPLAPDDYRLPLQAQQTLRFTLPDNPKQTVLTFRARIDAPGTIGSTNMLRLDLNGQTIGLKTPRRQNRLLNKPNRFPWTDPPSLTWFIPPGQWRLAYAPDFDLLRNTPYYGASAYEWTLDVTDLAKAGENELLLTHTGNPDVARNAKSDLTVYFRDFRAELRDTPGVLPGEPTRPDRNRPFNSGQRRDAAFTLKSGPAGSLLLTSAGQSYALTSRFSVAGEKLEWRDLQHTTSGATLTTPQWRLNRKLTSEPTRGRLLITDTFANLTDHPQGIRVNHALRLLQGRCERVNFGGREEHSLDELNRPSAPYLFLPRERAGVGLCAYDDVLRQHATLYYDDNEQVGGLRDNWFGLPARGSYTMTWAVYTTASPNVFDLVNLIRRDWGVAFRLEGGYNFFEPDQILAYDDAKLKQHLDLLNINVTMSQGGWLDRKLLLAGQKNIGHGPIVAGDYYADYRTRLRAACDKLRRLRPGIKCLIYYDSWLVAGEGIADRYADSFFLRADGRPRNFLAQTEWGFPLANVVPTLENTMGRESLAKIPPMIIDDIGADGLYWDEIAHPFQDQADYAHPDPYTWVIDDQTGQIKRQTGTPELAAQDFKLTFARAFLDRGKEIVGNGPPETLTEQKLRFPRFTETDIPHYLGLATKTWLYTPISYAGYATYHKPNVTEADFLADIRNKLWQANLYLYSAPMFYHLFTHENLATYQYPITVTGLDEGVIAGKERLITLRSGRFGWPGEKWQGELLLFDPNQNLTERKQVRGEQDGCVELSLKPDWAAIIVRN